jgi:hypothetical protein
MYKIVAVGRAKPGKIREGLAANKALAEHVGSKHDVKIEVYLQQFGPAGTIYMIGELPDLASSQALQGKLMKDETYWGLVQKAAEVVDPPTFSLLQQV